MTATIPQTDTHIKLITPLFASGIKNDKKRLELSRAYISVVPRAHGLALTAQLRNEF